MDTEDLNVTVLDDDVPVIEKPRVKRQMTEKQRSALEAGRARRKQRLEEKRAEATATVEVPEQTEEVPPPVKAVVIEKKRVACPDCGMEVAKSSMRNHRVRFHPPIDPPPTPSADAVPATEEPPPPKDPTQGVFLRKRKGMFLYS